MQTADKIQIALLCVQIFVAAVQVITTLYFIRSVGITQQQEKDAKDQIVLAQKQTELAQKQMELMARQYTESLRPLIAVTHKTTGSNVCEIELRNEGLGPALSVKCDPEIALQGLVIGSKSAVIAYVPVPRSAGSPHRQLYTLTYKSIDGQDYSTCFSQQHEQFSVVDYRELRTDADRALLEGFRAGFFARAT
jgi:hypothetical protein